MPRKQVTIVLEDRTVDKRNDETRHDYRVAKLTNTVEFFVGQGLSKQTVEGLIVRADTTVQIVPKKDR